MSIAELQSTLREVDKRVDEAMRAMAQQWESLAGDGGADVLGEDDVPALLTRMRSGGKQIRPAMCYWGWRVATSDDGSPGLEVATAGAALELLHLFALVHDDIMDDSDRRRGQPTIHVAAAGHHRDRSASGDAVLFGQSIAILAGDLAHAQAEWLAAGLPERVQSLWRTLVVELVLGQRRDLTGAAGRRRDLPHARAIARQKSGAYTIQRPLAMGAMLGDADEAQVDVLMSYGRRVGEAFALRDDLLGLWGDPRITGKPAGDDLLQGKPTVLLALASERLAPDDRALLETSAPGGLSPDQVTHLLEAIRTAGIEESVETMISTLVDEAFADLDRSGLSSAGVDGLKQMARQLAWRDA